MRAEDVPGEWVEIAAKAAYDASQMAKIAGTDWDRCDDKWREGWRRTAAIEIAAVAPLIAKAERERIAKKIDGARALSSDPNNIIAFNTLAAAIRALGDGKVGG